jgi:hypothetical protein
MSSAQFCALFYDGRSKFISGMIWHLGKVQTGERPFDRAFEKNVGGREPHSPIQDGESERLISAMIADSQTAVSLTTPSDRRPLPHTGAGWAKDVHVKQAQVIGQYGADQRMDSWQLRGIR